MKGENCEISSSKDCRFNKCLNNGTCVENFPDKYVCKCPNEFEGVNCETRVGWCSSEVNRCQNFAECLKDNNNDYKYAKFSVYYNYYTTKIIFFNLSD